MAGRRGPCIRRHKSRSSCCPVRPWTPQSSIKQASAPSSKLLPGPGSNVHGPLHSIVDRRCTRDSGRCTQAVEVGGAGVLEPLATVELVAAGFRGAAGLIDRVRRGHYAVRQLGVLGTPAAAEDIALSVGAALTGLPHRIAYRSALHEHDLVVHPARSIHVATDRRVRTRTLSGRPLRIVIEPPEALDVGRVPWGSSSLSDRHRAVLDAAQRPRLVGGLEVLAEAFAAATPELRADILMTFRNAECSGGESDGCQRRIVMQWFWRHHP